MRKNRRKTADDLFRHAKKRALQRYGVEITPGRMNALVKEIHENKSVMLLRESNNRSIHFVSDFFLVVYDKSKRTIATFLPPEALKGYLEAKYGPYENNVD